MADFLDKWVTESEDHARLVAQETLIVEVIEEIWRVLQEQGKDKADLAQALNLSKGHLTQLLTGSRNMTLRTLADICGALNVTPQFQLMVNSISTCTAEKTKRTGKLSSDHVPFYAAIRPVPVNYCRSHAGASQNC